MDWLLLGIVCTSSGEGENMSSIAQKLDVTLPQVTALATKVINLGLINQRTLESDHRSHLLASTEKGRLLFQSLNGSIEKALADMFAKIPSRRAIDYLETVKWLVTRNDTDNSDS
jgi:DNA-binding MarR family transcriptional regulator